MAIGASGFGVSTRRFLAIFGTATVVAQLGQLLWLMVGSRAMTQSAFGTVLAAQALYGISQFVVDSGTTYHGARLVAAGTLEPGVRASIVRVRLQLATVSALLTLVIGAAGGVSFLVANGPYAVALVGWALFNYWEPFGRGNGKPLSAYLVLRSFGPPLATLPFFFSAGESPVYVAGSAEVISLAIVAWGFRLRPLSAFSAALGAERGPWRKVAAVGAPSIAWQVGLGSGTVLLAVGGAPAAAAFLGVGVRLLTGVNQLSAVLVTSLFPELARRGADDEQGAAADQTGVIDLAVRIVVLVTAVATAVFLAKEAFFVDLFVQGGGTRAESTAALTMASAGVCGISLLVAFVLVARHRESIAAYAFCLGAVIAIVAGVGVIAVDPRNESLWMAAALASGQLVGAVVVAYWAAKLMPYLRRTLYLGLASGSALLGGAVLSIAAPPTRPYVAAAAGALGFAAFSSTFVLRWRTSNS